MYLRYPLSYQDTADLLAERSVFVDSFTVYRWDRDFSPQVTNGLERRRQWVGLFWHVDETYIRVGRKWRCLWRTVDRRGHFINFRLIAQREAKATLRGIEAIRTIKNRYVYNMKPGIRGEIALVYEVFGLAARSSGLSGFLPPHEVNATDPSTTQSANNSMLSSVDFDERLQKLHMAGV